MLWCFGALSLRYSTFKNANLRTDRFSFFFLILRTCHRPFFENVLNEIENVLPAVFGIPAPYERDNPVTFKVYEFGLGFRA